MDEGTGLRKNKVKEQKDELRIDCDRDSKWLRTKNVAQRWHAFVRLKERCSKWFKEALSLWFESL